LSGGGYAGGPGIRRCETNDELVELVKYRAESYIGRGARDGRVLQAMRSVDRASFLPAESRWAAYMDEAVDIGRGQTCSQPSMVAFMLDKLELRPGLGVLEVGAGCGYAAALLTLLCSPGGRVVAAEILPELAAAARANIAVALAGRAAWADSPEILAADASAGLPGREPFDRVLLSAGVERPAFREELLLDQLRPGGMLIYPEARGRLYRVRLEGGDILRESWGGVAFVPLKGRNS
jgi:protein-L-isoaspartate(D-aspartate) O-methyltransferase